MTPRKKGIPSPRLPRNRLHLLAIGGAAFALFAALFAYPSLSNRNRLALARSQTLRIGYQRAPPYQLVSETGERGGVGLDIVSKAAERLGLQLEWVYSPLSPDENFAAGNVDLWPIVTDLPHRRQNFYISQPIYENALGLLFLESETIKDFADVGRRRIAFFNREPGITLTRRLLPDAELLPLPSHRDAIDAVFYEECDAAFLWSTKSNSNDFEEAIATHRDQPFRFHYFTDQKTTCGIAASRLNPAAIAAADLIREEIRSLVREGFVHETYFRYFLDPENEISSYFYLDDLQRTTHRQYQTIAALAAALLALVVLALQLRRSRRSAYAASEAKSQFLATMSHEFRTPLNGIMGMAQLAELTDLDEEQQEYVAVIKQSAGALATIVNDVLDISKIEAGRLDLEYAPVALAELMRSIAPFFEIMALRKGLDFESTIDPACPEIVVTDAARLRQVLFNLLGNAIKFTARGKVSIAVAPARLLNEERLLFEVHDTGIGIPVERQSDVFEAFTQVDGSFNRAYGGTGLGLSISRYLVSLLGGELRVQSVHTEGSVFSVFIPLIHADSESADDALFSAPSRLESPIVEGAQLRVLVVDDNPSNLQAMQATLEKLGHSVTTAGDGLSAVELFAPGRYDLILLDLQRPILDGPETARLMRLKEGSTPNRTAIVAISAYPLQETTDGKIPAALDGYLRKPIEIRLLIKEIAKVRARAIDGK